MIIANKVSQFLIQIGFREAIAAGGKVCHGVLLGFFGSEVNTRIDITDIFEKLFNGGVGNFLLSDGDGDFFDVRIGSSTVRTGDGDRCGVFAVSAGFLPGLSVGASDEEVLCDYFFHGAYHRLQKYQL